MFFGGSGAKFPNTFIGGVGFTSITNEADLINKISTPGITEADIKLFEVDSYGNVSFYVKKSYSIDGASFSPDTSLTYYFDIEDKLIVIGVTAFYQTINPRNFKIGYFPKALSSSNSNPRTFYNQWNLENLILDMVGDPNQTSAFGRAGRDVPGRTGKLFCNVLEETSYAGLPNKNISATENYLTPVYILDYTKPNPISDLSVSDITATSVKLNFTAPYALNGIYKYEVWDDKRFIKHISASGETITGLTSATLHKFKVVAADTYYNRSDWSNIEEITTL